MKQIKKKIVVSFEFTVSAEDKKSLKAAIADMRISPAYQGMCAGEHNYNYQRGKNLGKILSERPTK